MKTQIHKLIVLNHVLAALGLIYGPANFLWFTIIGWILFGKIGGEIGLHRYFAHHSFKTNIFYHRLLIFLAALNCIGSPLSWVGVHRKHHAYPDSENDPHGNQTPIKVWLTVWRPFNIEVRSIYDLMKDPLQRFVHKYYFLFIFTSIFFLYLVHPWLPIFLICIPCIVTFHSAGLVNVICHNFGYRTYETRDRSYNNLFVNFLTLGSGLHNNHHAEPQSPYNSKNWYEVDFPGLIIKYVLI